MTSLQISFDPQSMALLQALLQKLDATATPTVAAPAAAAPAPAIGLETVRAKLAELSGAGKREQVKALLGEFGVAKLTELDPTHYPTLMTKAEAL